MRLPAGPYFDRGQIVGRACGRWVRPRLTIGSGGSASGPRFDVQSKAAARFAMGLLAQCLLLIAEDILTRLLRGVSVFEHWAGFTLLGNATNIAGLLAFFLMPLLVRRTAEERPSRARSS